MPQFSVTVTERPAVHAAGLKITTDMQRCHTECQEVWNRFGPLMASFPADSRYPNQCFGISLMHDQNSFDYWAAMPLAEGAPVPEDMTVFDIAAGHYAECPIRSIEEMGDAYNSIYLTWGPAQNDYALNMHAASYELYTDDYLKTGALTLYCPLSKV